MTRTDASSRRRPSLASVFDRVIPARLRGRRILVVVPLLLLVAFAGMRLRGGEAPPLEPFEPIAADTLTLRTLDAIGVGEAVPVTIEGLPEATPATLIVDSGYGLRQFEIPPTNGQATVEIPALDVPATGLMTLTVIAGDATGRGAIELVSGTAVDPLEILLGPRTIEATGTTATMIVVIPQDALGNPLVDGTPVDVNITRSDLRAQQFTIQTDRLIAWSRIRSSTTAGRSRVGVVVDDAGGKEFEFLEIAGTPVPFDLVIVGTPPLADGRSLVQVRTSQLIDEFGNVLPDGINVFADVTGDNGMRRLTAQTINGEAEFTIEAPATAGVQQVVVNASGRLSSPLDLEFFPMVVDPFDVVVRSHPDGAELVVGPVTSALEAYIPDGTPVVVTIDERRLEVPSFEGVAAIVIEPPFDGPITISVLGAERTVRVGS